MHLYTAYDDNYLYNNKASNDSPFGSEQHGVRRPKFRANRIGRTISSRLCTLL
jgi:hypothetical protein